MLHREPQYPTLRHCQRTSTVRVRSCSASHQFRGGGTGWSEHRRGDTVTPWEDPRTLLGRSRPLSRTGRNAVNKIVKIGGGRKWRARPPSIRRQHSDLSEPHAGSRMLVVVRRWERLPRRVGVAPRFDRLGPALAVHRSHAPATRETVRRWREPARSSGSSHAPSRWTFAAG